VTESTLLVELKLKKSDPDAYTRLAADVANNRPIDPSPFEWLVVQSPIFHFRNEIIEHVRVHGLSSFFFAQRLTEALVAKGSSIGDIVSMFHVFLSALPVDDELIIVDPYFLPTGVGDENAYADLFAKVLGPYIAGLQIIRIITNTKYSSSLLKIIEAKVAALNPPCKIIHTTSNDYHDRFWLSAKRKQGILTGTSLNGLGNKYALIDRLQADDVEELVKALVTGHLLQ